MKTLLAFIVYVFILVSCKHSQEVFNESENTNMIKLHEGNWISNFKNEVFIRCLKKLYPVSFTETFETIDGSTAANLEQLDFDQGVIRQADSLSTSFMKRKELSWQIENRKIILNLCVAYRNSKELDEATLKIYRNFVSRKKRG